MKKTIRTLSELRKLRSFKARRGVRDVEIKLPGSVDEIQELETEVNKRLKACGCEIGAIFVAVGLLALVVFSIIMPNYFNWASPKTFFGIVGSLGALALTGKIIGLAIANWRLRLAIDKLERETLRMAVEERVDISTSI